MTTDLGLAGLDDFLALHAVLSLDDTWNAAYQARETAALARVLADDWQGFLPNGQPVNKPVLLAALASYPDEPLRFERLAAQLYGEAAITWGTLHSGAARLQGFMRVYARRDGQWQAVAVQVVP